MSSSFDSYRVADQFLLVLGADVQFTRSHRLDVCLVRNHNMALYVPTLLRAARE